MIRRLHLFGLAVFAILLAACGGGGGGGGGGGNPPPVNASPGGIWSGTLADGTVLLGLVTETGEFHFIQDDDTQFFGTLNTSVNAVNGSFQGIAALGFTFPDGTVNGTGTFTGSVQQRVSFGGTSVFRTTAGNQTTTPIALAYDALYDRDSSLATFAGNYMNADGVVVNVNSNGVIFSQDAASGCVINGQVSVMDGRFNAYRVQYTYSSCIGQDAVLNGVTMRGIATLDNTSPPDEFIIAGVTGSSGSLFVSLVHVLIRN